MADTTIAKDEATKKRNNVQNYIGIPQDIFAWSLGIVFFVAVVLAMMVFGYVRRWDAQSGFTHNSSATSAERFLPEPRCDKDGDSSKCDSTASSRWYYWQLPPKEASAMSRAVVWICYTSHQLFIWGTIYVAQRVRARNQESGPRYSNTMTKYQWVPLLGNVCFHLLHLAQTHWTYDGLAKDVSEASSQGSVIMLLVFVLLMEYRDRGLFFGWPTVRHTDKVSRALRLQQGPTNLLRKYHGYVFAWSAIYTFWYHPMENTWGHVLGFAHTWMIMLQGSLMFTNIHLNRYWRLLIEFWVTIHSTLVAVQTSGSGYQLWMMFCFGFLWIFLMTQLFALPFWKKLPWWTKPIPFTVYSFVMFGLYGFYFVDSQGRHWVRINEIIRIPGIEYASVLLSWICLWFFLKVEGFIKRRSSIDNSRTVSEVTEVVHILLSLCIYAIMLLASYLIQELNWEVDLTTLMVVFVFLFIVLVSISTILLKQTLTPVRNLKVTPSKVESKTAVELKAEESSAEENGGFHEH